MKIEAWLSIQCKLIIDIKKYLGLIDREHYNFLKNSLIIHETNTKEIIAVKESLYVIKH